jgi:GNAT superfamily N-acetyltransferase
MRDAVSLSLSQFSRSWRQFAAASPGSLVENGNGVEYVFCGLPIPFFNIAFVTEAGLTAEALANSARTASERASGTGMPWMLLVTAERLAPGVDASAVLDGVGFAPVIPLTGMVAERVTPAARVPSGLDLEVPVDDTACGAMIDVNSRAYGMDLDACKSLYGTHAFWARHVPALGRVDGTPVTCAAVLIVDGYRYVALVATDPPYQRRGFSDAAMRHALEVAASRHGDLPTFLHATEAGRPLYARMGYTPVSTHTGFMDKRFLGDHRS